MPKKRIMHKFSMNAISSVDSPAQAGANMVIMKRDDEDLAKLMFDEALADLQLSKEVWSLIDEQWELNDALQSSIFSIVKDKETYPDPVSAVKVSLTQYASAVADLINETKADIDDGTVKAEIGKRAWQLANPEDPSESTQKSEEGNMPTPKKDETTPTLESLAEELKVNKTDLQIAKAYGELNDSDKAHYKTLDETAQGDFLGMTSDQRSEEVTKSAVDDDVVYTADDGAEFRKSDDPRLVAMAKRADKNEQIAKVEREKAHNLEIAKRVKEEIPNVPAEEDAKVALYKAVDAIKNEDMKKAIFAIFKAHNEIVKMSLEKLGEKDAELLKAEDELEVKAKEFQKEHKIETFEKAYSQFLDTPEGQALYEKTQEPATA